MIKHFNIGRHYDAITDGWRYIFGDNFHFGYFKTPEDNLDKATDHLIDELASLCSLESSTKILDAGCGIGTPAIYLNHKYGSAITGVSTSSKGISIAGKRIPNQEAKKSICFMVADMTATGFPDESFDVVWVMESSHLIQDKELLMKEFHRLLKPGGHVLLADVMLSRQINTVFRLKNIFKFITLLRAFGRGKLETSDYYASLMRQTGFKNIFAKNIKKEAEGTLDWWEKNIEKNRSKLLEIMKTSEINAFEKAVAVLRYFFREDYFCYYIIRAEK